MTGAGGSRRRCLGALAGALGSGLAGATPLSGGSPAADPALAALYRPGRDAPLWLAPDGRPAAAAREAVALLAAAAEDGLDPADYGAAALADTLSRLQSASEAAAAVAFEQALSRAMLRWLRELHVGRVDPRRVGFRLPPRDTEHDWSALLRDAVEGGRLTAAADGLRPALAPYRELRGQLARYRALAAAGPWPPLAAPAQPLRPGDRHPVLAELAARLRRLGDLGADLPAASDAGPSLDGELLAAVRRFQDRHGLDADGVIGRATWAALDVSPARRARQIELAMERLRWLPHGDGGRLVVVNIPMFRLWARDPSGAAAPSMPVIVGRAMRTDTPVFVDRMEYLIFRPYWNVPPSIVRGEILPALARQPGYLERHEMEIVRGGGDDATPVPATAENLALLRQGVLRLRQRPGAQNALGRVKFIFPNDANVYLHDTPSPQLFQRTRRDFSHGCIRIADPRAMAEWVLSDRPEWTRERIAEAMERGPGSQRVDLRTPVRVVIYYLTALALPGEATPRFAEDLYGHDATLERALASRAR